MKFQYMVGIVGLSVASGLIVYYLTKPKNVALATCAGGKGAPSPGVALMRGWSPARMFGTKSDVETEFAACPLGTTCNIGGVCACTFCGTGQPNGYKNTPKGQSGAIQSWTGRLFQCGRSSCYAAAIRAGKTCSSTVVATQGAAGTCGWGKCSDFASCC